MLCAICHLEPVSKDTLELEETVRSVIVFFVETLQQLTPLSTIHAQLMSHLRGGEEEVVFGLDKGLQLLHLN